MDKSSLGDAALQDADHVIDLTGDEPVEVVDLSAATAALLYQRITNGVPSTTPSDAALARKRALLGLYLDTKA